MHSTSLYLIIVLILILRFQFLALCFSPCILSLCQPLLTHTLSYIIYLLMTYNCRCLLPQIEYMSYLTLCSDVKDWATVNMLKLNDNKTELMLVTSKRTKHLHYLPTSITIGNAQFPFKHSVKKVGLTLDCHPNTNAHVSNIARTCYFELRSLASIRRFLTSTATATVVPAFVFSRMDYSNSLLLGSTNDVTSHLQRIQNNAARVILRLPMSSSMTTHLKSLHWLPVNVRSSYKTVCEETGFYIRLPSYYECTCHQYCSDMLL